MQVDPATGIPLAPQWALATGQAGQYALWASLALFALAFAACLFGERWVRAGKLIFLFGSVATWTAIVALGVLFAQDQFSFRYVWSHGDSLTDLRYKVAGIWTAQEGSFLLWAVCSALFGVLTLRAAGPLSRGYVAVYALFQALIAGILVYETPFGLMPEVVQDGKVFLPPRGNGMTPALQNYWVAIHPPVIFLGFGSLTVFFAFAVASLLHRNATEWVPRARAWALASLGLLGLGLCMGGLWAYETQGWGGFWVWDPVENVSLVPWVLMTVLVHGFIVQTARGKWAAANLLIGALPFLAFLYGTFLTRSGLLDKVSVHSFAQMDQNALQILRWAMFGLVGAYFALYAWRVKLAAATVAPIAEPEGLIRREAAYRGGMLLMCLLAFVVAVGMSWPVITALRGGEGARVEEWLYHLVVVWFFVPIMVLMAIGPLISWRGESKATLGEKLFHPIGLSLGFTGFTLMAVLHPATGIASQRPESIAGPFGTRLLALPVLALLLFVCWLVAITALWRMAQMGRRAGWTAGGFVAHFGLAVLLAGLIVSRGFEAKDRQFILQDSPARILDYTVTYQGLDTEDIYDRDGKAKFLLRRDDGTEVMATPGLYYYDQGEETRPQVWPFIDRYWSHDLYVSLYPPQTDVWQEPVVMKPGEQREFEGIGITYVKPIRSGSPGQPGARFGGEFRIRTRDGNYTVRPYMELVQGGVEPSFTPVGEDLLAVISRVDAADQSAELRLLFRRPLYPIEVFYKPLTSLVWVGTGILTLGTLMAAVGRRRRTVPVTETQPSPVSRGIGTLNPNATSPSA